MDEPEISFTESEVAQILWVLTDAAEHAADTDSYSALVLIEQTLRMVRERFDDRGERCGIRSWRWLSE